MKYLPALSMLLAVASCSKNQPPAPEPEQYRYQITVMSNADDGGDVVDYVAGIRINGTTAPVKNGEVIVPKDTRLTDPATRLEIVRNDSCGESGIEARNMPAYDTERSETAARASAAKNNQAISWKIATTSPPGPPQGVGLYIDNRNGAATTVRVGATVINVPANSATEGSAIIGNCATGDEVAIGEKVVGKLSGLPAGMHVLVDIAGGHCYREFETAYGNDVPPDGTGRYLASAAGVHLHRVSKIDSLFAVNPSTVTKYVREGNESAKGATLTSLLDVACSKR